MKGCDQDVPRARPDAAPARPPSGAGTPYPLPRARPGRLHRPLPHRLAGMDAPAATLVLTCMIAAPAGAQLVTPGLGAELADAPGRDIYAASCANCHGLDGTGLDRSLVAFEEELPDFTDCDFAAREPDADWIAVAHEGGPVRGFSEMMPAFRGALTTEQLGRVMSYIRTLCTDSDWPRGELNLPAPSSPRRPIRRMNGWWRVTGTSRTAMP